jgi:hypothetical protein
MNFNGLLGQLMSRRVQVEIPSFSGVHFSTNELSENLLDGCHFGDAGFSGQLNGLTIPFF